MTTPPQDAPATPPPDDKDWTWVLREPCPECGVSVGTVAGAEIAGQVRAYTDPWAAVLARPDAAVRPAPATWSPLEYACHVRDVCRLFDERLRLMLEHDSPRFANWDQDETAVAERYDAQDPATVAGELSAAAGAWAASWAAVPNDAWDRPGFRSNGSEFTVLTLGQYGLHDLAHHLHDVGVDHP
ncbi:DinB family protein [Oryzobacter telluris]|uniref:DinB family protein n=1 Tax=Oryzobacter telluris TaxID=3149179 RepID=UPI00370CFE12